MVSGLLGLTMIVGALALGPTAEARPTGTETAAVVLTPSGLLPLVPGAPTTRQPGSAPAAAATATSPRRAPAVAPAARLPRRTMLVRVVDAPAGVTPKVVITGPKGFTRTLTRTTVLKRLRPGVYRIRPQVVPMADGQQSVGTTAKARAKVTRKRGATVTVSYWNIVGAQTRVPAAAQVASVVGDPFGGITAISLTGPVYAVGDVIALGVTPATPAGLLAKVTSVAEAGGVTTYQVTQARLQDALPRGAFDVTIATAEPGPRGLKRTREKSPTETKPFTCTGSVAGSVTAYVDAGISMRFSPEWDWADTSLTLASEAHALGHADVTVAAQASCTLAETQLGTDIMLPVISFTIGPVPIVIVPTLAFAVDGSASVAGVAKASADLYAGTSYSLKVTTSGDVTSAFEPPNTKASKSIDFTTNADATVRLKAKLTGEIYGVAGPYATVAVGPVFHASLEANPWWTLKGKVTGGAGIAIDQCVFVACIGLSGGKDDIFTKDWDIADAGGPFGATPTPTPTPTPNPGTRAVCSAETLASVLMRDVCLAAQSDSAEALKQLCLASTKCLVSGRAQMFANWERTSYRDDMIRAMNAGYGGADLATAPASAWIAEQCASAAEYSDSSMWTGGNLQVLQQDGAALGFATPTKPPRSNACPQYYTGPAVYWIYSFEDTDAAGNATMAFIGTRPWGTPWDAR